MAYWYFVANGNFQINKLRHHNRCHHLSSGQIAGRRKNSNGNTTTIITEAIANRKIDL